MAPSRKALYEDDRTWFWKFILRMLTIVLASVGIGCVAWAFATSSGGFEDPFYYGFYGTSLVPWDLIPLGLSILWNFANIAVLLSRNRPIAPGANVGCDLLLWLSLLGTGILLVISAQDNIGSKYLSGYVDGYIYGHPYIYRAYDRPSNHVQGVVEAVGSGFTFVVMLCHFALFVSACRYTHKRRQARMTPQAAAMMAREMVAEMTKNGQLESAQTPLSGTSLPRQQSFPGSASQAAPMQQQKSLAADPRVQVPQEQQPPQYPLATVQQPPSPIQVPDPSSFWILPGSKPTIVVPSGNHAEQRATMSSPPSPVSPQSPISRGHSVLHATSNAEDRSQAV